MTTIAHDRPLRHMVCVRFQEGTDPEDIRQVEQAFAALPAKIPGIIGFEAGCNVSVEDKHKGFTHLWLLTFENEAARDFYLPHPAHHEFSRLLSQFREDVFVFDYITGEQA